MISRKRQLNDQSIETTVNLNTPNNDGMSIKKIKLNEGNEELIATLYSLDTTKYPNIQLYNKSKTFFGRSKKKNNDFILSAADCSSIHCKLLISDKGPNNTTIVSIKDLSSNGTFINDTLVGKENTTLIRDGDKLSFASNLHYIVKYEIIKSKASFFDKYILTERILGTGHYAQVKEAINRETEEVCAVKIFHPTTKKNEGDANQLNRELDILTKLNHPNIVGFYSTHLEPVNQCSITTYLVLEKVNGGELFNRIVRKGKLNPPEARSIMTQLIQGLSYLHSRDIVHRDLKPENILLSITTGPQQSPWDEGESQVIVKIADFGLAKFIGKVQFTNTLCGTPAYVAPEVLVNSHERKYNRAVDMWSVGVLLYVCLCGFPPFSEELGPPTMRQQIIEGKYAFYSPYWDGIDDLMLDLISRLLVVDPAQRLSANQVLVHPWITEGVAITENGGSIEGGNPLDLTGIVRIESKGYCEPITIKHRVETGLTDERIIQEYCQRDNDGDLSMSK